MFESLVHAQPTTREGDMIIVDAHSRRLIIALCESNMGGFEACTNHEEYFSYTGLENDLDDLEVLHRDENVIIYFIEA